MHILVQVRPVKSAFGGSGGDHLGIPAGIAIEDIEAIQHVEVIHSTLAVKHERVLVHFEVGRPAAFFACPPVEQAVSLSMPC